MQGGPGRAQPPNRSIEQPLVICKSYSAKLLAGYNFVNHVLARANSVTVAKSIQWITFAESFLLLV